MGGLIIPSLGRAHLGADLRRNRALCATMLEIVPSLVLAINAQGNVVNLNRACRETTGFSLRDFRGRPVWNLLFVPEKSEAVRRTVCACQTDAASRVVEAELITKGGERRHSRWVVQATPALRQDPQLVLLAGIDCADLVEAQRKVQQLEQRAEKLAGMLGESGEEYRAKPAPGPQAEPDGREPAGRRGGRDRRTSHRMAFQYKQRIAPMRSGRFPSPGDFFEVDCYDISAGGFSFFLDREPDFDTLAVELGTPPRQSFLAARVARFTSQGSTGRRRVLVGCRFLERLSSRTLWQSSTQRGPRR